MGVEESQITEFIKRLPDISKELPTVHLIMLAARSRCVEAFCGEKIKDLVVERKIIRPHEDWRLRYEYKLENLVTLQQKGRYDFKEYMLPPEAFGLFATIMPRSCKSAIVKLTTDIFKAMSDQEKTLVTRIDVKFFGKLHGSAYRRPLNVITLDIDNPDIYKDVRDRVTPLDVWMVTKTARGYHIILDISKKDCAREFHIGGGIWEQMKQKYKKDVELQRDPQEPIPGTLYFADGKPQNRVEIIE